MSGLLCPNLLLKFNVPIFTVKKMGGFITNNSVTNILVTNILVTNILVTNILVTNNLVTWKFGN